MSSFPNTTSRPADGTADACASSWRPATVAVDAPCLAREWSGVAYWTAGAISGLRALLPRTAMHIFLGTRWVQEVPSPPMTAAGSARWRARAMRAARTVPGARAAWHGLCRSRFTAGVTEIAPDVILAVNYVPSAPADRVVPVVHDLSHIRLPQVHPADRVRRLERLLPPTLERAPVVVSVSHFTRREMVALLGIREERIIVAPPAVAPAFAPVNASVRGTVLRRLGLEDRRYFLAVGNLEPRKNLATLIAAYADLPPRVRTRHALVLAGGAGWGDAGLSTPVAQRLRQAGQLRLLGYVAPADLPALYAGATAFCFPSIYEGFGMPVAEAMACAAPVIAADATAIPEVAGAAGLLVDPHDPVAWTRALSDVAEDPARAETMRRLGPPQAARFTWQACGRALVDAFAAWAPERRTEI